MIASVFGHKKLWWTRRLLQKKMAHFRGANNQTFEKTESSSSQSYSSKNESSSVTRGYQAQGGVMDNFGGVRYAPQQPVQYQQQQQPQYQQLPPPQQGPPQVGNKYNYIAYFLIGQSHTWFKILRWDTVWQIFSGRGWVTMIH